MDGWVVRVVAAVVLAGPVLAAGGATTGPTLVGADEPAPTTTRQAPEPRTAPPGAGASPTGGGPDASIPAVPAAPAPVRAGPPASAAGLEVVAQVPPAEPAPTPPVGTGTVAPGARYAWPLLPPPVVLTPFDEPEHLFGRGHRGVDLAGAPGQPVLAAEGGVVVQAGPLAGRGVVSVQHPDGLRTTYEPVTTAVAAGAVVARGAVLGALEAGHPGCVPACLHWGVRRDRLHYVDPLVLLRPPHVRLLPVPDPWPL